MANGEQRLPEPVTGTAPGSGPSVAKGDKHHEGWDKALDNAISEIERRWGDPATYAVTITLEADIEIVNPGGVGQYRVTLS